MPQGSDKLSDCKIRQIEIWINDTTFTPPPDTTHPCDPDTIYFEMDVLPILLSSCGLAGCHDATAQDGVRLDSYNAVMASDVIKPFDLNDSELWENINETDPDKIMPPPPNAPLGATQKEIIRKWIEQGAQNLFCDEMCDTTNVTFSGTIWPEIIQNYCFGCHNGANASGGVHLENHSQVAAAANIPAGSFGSFWGAITHASGNSPMPKNQPMLSDCKITQVKKWIDAGTPND
jgi:mono/diheme cytochrome c family protein